MIKPNPISEQLKTEVQLAEDECCIIFDFGCFFPYFHLCGHTATFRARLGTSTKMLSNCT